MMSSPTTSELFWTANDMSTTWTAIAAPTEMSMPPTNRTTNSAAATAASGAARRKML